MVHVASNNSKASKLHTHRLLNDAQRSKGGICEIYGFSDAASTVSRRHHNRAHLADGHTDCITNQMTCVD